MSTRNAREIVRYTAGTRINHWIVAISFVLLALSGLALFHPALFWLTNLFGGGPWTRILHPFIGCVMAAAFYLLCVKFWRDNRMQGRDWIWLRKINDVAANREENLPDVGRYNGGQKLLFFTLVVCLIVLLLSGIVVPLTSLPGVIRRTAVALPPGAMAEGLHRTLGQGLGATGTDWLVLGVWALLAPLVAARTFRFD